MSADQLLSDIELSSPRRSSTIESGRTCGAMENQPMRRGFLLRSWKIFAGKDEARQDATQILLANTIHEAKDATSLRHAPDLRHLRRLSKERPLWHFLKLVEEEATVSAWMCHITSMLKVKTGKGPELIALAEEPGSEDLTTFFSFNHYTQATISGNLTTIHREPVWILLFVLADTWGIDLLPWSPGSGTQDAQRLARPMPLMPPSLRSARKVTPESSPRIYWGLEPQRQGNLDPNPAFLVFLQLRQVSTFTRDLNVYIWEPHTRFPSTEHAKIILCQSHDQEDAIRLLISLRSCRLLAAYTDKRDACSALESTPVLGGIASQSWSNTLLSVLCVLEVLVSDTAEFLQAYHDEVARMRVVSRQDPTISKLRFMMHLDDSRKIASDGVKHATRVLSALAVWAEQHIQPRAEGRAGLLHTKKMAALQQDLEFCDRELDRLGSYTEADQETLRRHFQLSQDLTLFRLTLLAAIFLPLSFTTSLFGMNMRNTAEGPSTFSNVTNDLLGNITDVNLRNSAEAIVSIVASSGNLNYDWAIFAGTAIGLLFILPFTLAVGTIMRTTVVSVVRYVKYWRALTLLVGGLFLLVVMTFSIFGGVLDQWTYDLWYSEDADDSLDWGLVDHISIIGIITYWISNGLLLLVLIFLVYESWRERKERLFWTTQLLLTAICFTVDMVVFPYPFVPMIIPWVWLGLLNPWVRRRWRKARFSKWR
ncbi:hypothetical protein diail_6575 [Diaporthe ilicicola]|nr:hypothetical protein diail_6575 [Diaporthe ilicicola]